jgi:hypothetical protein
VALVVVLALALAELCHRQASGRYIISRPRSVPYSFLKSLMIEKVARISEDTGQSP